MRFSFRRARNICPWPVPCLLACLLLLGLFLPPSTSADPPSPVGIASVADGSADDVLGQLLDLDFSQPDFTHGAANDSVTADALERPGAVALDAVNHRLFVADDNNNRVLLFDLTAGNALADRTADRVLGQADLKGNNANRGGSATANTLSSPRGLAYDASGNRLLVADTGNSRVLVYNTAAITNGQDAVSVLGQATFTGTASAISQSGLNGPDGLAYDSTNSRLFVADNGNSRVLVYDVSIVTNGENATNVLGQADFISDGAATTQSGLDGPRGLAYDSSGSRLFVADNTNSRVVVYDVASISNGQNAVNVLGQADFISGGSATTQGGLNGPRGLAYDSSNNRLFVADRDNNRVMAYDVASIGNGENAVKVLGQADFVSGDINRGGNPAANTLNRLSGLAYDAAGSRLWAADQVNNRVLVYDLATIVDGESAVDLVGQVDASGNAIFTTNIAASARVSNRGFNSPRAAAVDAANHRLFLADSSNHRVLVYNLDPGNRPLDRQPDAVLGQADFTSGNANRGGSVAANTLNTPLALAYDATGNRLLVADFFNHRVLLYDTATITNGQNAVNVLGQADFTSGNANRGGSVAANTLSAPAGLAHDASGNRLFVTDLSNNRVLVYNVAAITDGEAAEAVLGQVNFTSGASNRGGARAANTLAGPQTPAYDSSGSRLFVADNSNNRVLVYNVAAITDGEDAVAVLGQANFTTGSTGAATANNLNSPGGLAYDAAVSRLLVADSGNNRVLVYDSTTISNGQSAVAVQGQADFTSSNVNRGGNVAANTLRGPNGVAYDASADILYVPDQQNHRLLLFNAAGPSGGAISINGGATYASSITATLALTATGASQMQVSESASFTGASYQTYSTTLPFTLTAGDGARAIYTRFRDSALGVSAAVSDTIIVDTTPPLTFTLSSPATGTFTNTASPTLAWEAASDATSGLAKYQLHLDGALNRDNVLTSTIFITPTGTLTDGLHTWNMVAVDHAANSRQSSATNSLTVDTIAPLTFTLASPATGAYTNTASPVFFWEGSSDTTSGLAKYQLFVDGTLNRDNILTSANSITATGALTDGVHTWRVVAVDNAGNSRESGSSNSVTVDTVAPSPSQVSVTGVTTGTATISWSSSEAASTLVEYGATDAYGAATAEADTSPRATSHSVALAGLTPGTTYHYRVGGQDQAGNLGVSGDNTFGTLSPVSNTYIPLLTRSFAGGW